MKIGIITYHYSNNYGALLQAYALSTALKKIGCEPVIINRVPDTMDNNFIAKIKVRINQAIQKHFQNSFYQFRQEFLPSISKQVNGEEIKKIANHFDAIIVGSDQVWRIEYTRGLGLNNFLDFVPNGIKKIAYAASFGNDEFDGDKETVFKVGMLLSKFDAISVREDTGVIICKEIFGLNALHLLDPALLLQPSDYDTIIKEQKSNKREKFITQYFLDTSGNKSEIARIIATEMHLKTRNIYRESNKDFSLKSPALKTTSYHYPSFSTWLSGIRDAEFVITDSFHGIIFAILYNKQFICVANESRGLTRMISLLKKFGLESRIIFETELLPSDILSQKIDYKFVNQILQKEQLKSIDFLINSIRS